MRTKVIQVNVSRPPSWLFIGRQGENEATIFDIDLSDYVSQYGAGTADILVQRDGDESPFASVTTLTGNVLSWPITNLETAIVGTGQAQLVYTVNGVIAKTQIFPFSVSRSLGEAGDPPEPWESWVDDVLAAAGEARVSAGDAAQSASDAQAAQEAAETAQRDAEAALAEFTSVTAEAETLPAGSDATASYADGLLTFGIPQGEKGETGATGATGPQGPKGDIGASAYSYTDDGIGNITIAEVV